MAATSTQQGTSGNPFGDYLQLVSNTLRPTNNRGFRSASSWPDDGLGFVGDASNGFGLIGDNAPAAISINIASPGSTDDGFFTGTSGTGSSGGSAFDWLAPANDSLSPSDAGYPQVAQPFGGSGRTTSGIPSINLDPYQQTLATGANRDMDLDDYSSLRPGFNGPSMGISAGSPWSTVSAPFSYAGNILRALPLDIAEGWAGQNVYGTPFENMAAAALGEKVLPADAQLQAGSEESPLAGTLANISQGASRSIPKMIGIAAMPASLPYQMAGSGLLFGLDDDGNFNAKNAAVAALLPGVGAGARALAGGAITKGIQMGIGSLNNPLVQKAVTTGAEQAALNGYSLATQAPDLVRQYQADPGSIWATLGSTIGQNAAFGALHLNDETPGVVPATVSPAKVIATQSTLPIAIDAAPGFVAVKPQGAGLSNPNGILIPPDSQLAGPGKQPPVNSGSQAAPVGATGPEAAAQPRLGGAYRDIPALGGERHHMPAKDVSTLSEGEGPAIWMETSDHAGTASWGKGDEPAAYRAAQADLINQGKFREALQKDIDDIRSQFGAKYDTGIQQMLDYYNTIPAWKLSF